MFTILLVGKSSFISNYLNSLNKNKFSVKFFPNIDETLQNIDRYEPKLILLVADQEETDLLDFCKKIREKYSLLLPILLVVDFYSFVNLNQFKNLGVDFIIKPFTQEEFNAKIESFLSEQEKTVEHIYEKESEIIDKLRPYIREEVRAEMQTILKQILEGMEQKHV
ncbi:MULTISPECIES: response regulator [Thermodesulfovibrio]|uniref:Response regulator receiver domain protein n=2 Tax=Thermodesulfovibrio yellowstonii TaxID=28262 RepID=B5YKF6_THEYD|nr:MULTISPECIES: response regulator [Thermodesulfovibrio]ACI20460.1 response regulator receiver domain protein [Thermodesulfovibrio yellowstonii DSM 11347]MDI6865731.1 response regulator [Thermodesulfovibrio yellowstonii]GLI53427.1 transcriptional regulator [Thermodesulfovibrio islandicus]